LNEEDLLDIQSTPEGPAYLDQILFLKRFPPEHERDRWNGPTMYVYRLKQIENELNILFGDQIRLVGFDLSASEVTPGDVISLSPYWQAATRPSADYHVYASNAAEQPRVIAQSDGRPQRVPACQSMGRSTETILGREFRFRFHPTLRRENTA
jgi:hypothetical protein